MLTIKKDEINGEATVRVFDNWVKMTRSENTKLSYSRIVPQFIEMVFDTDLKGLTADMLGSLVPDDVDEKFVMPLRAAGFKDTTLLNYMNVFSSFTNRLEVNRVFDGVDYKFIRDEVLSTKRFHDDTENRSVMSFTEYEEFTEWLKNKEFSKRYKNKGFEYAMALKFMFSTAVRIDSTFNKIHWNNIKREEDIHGNYVWIVYAFDKGKRYNRKPITDEFYEELKATFYKGDNEELVFGTLSKQTFTKLTSEFSSESGRELTPHSIKVGAGTRLYNMTKDIILVQKFLDHKSIEMTIRYIRMSEDSTQSGSYLMTSNINIDNIKKIEYDTLMDIISSNSDIAYRILGEAKKGGFI